LLDPPRCPQNGRRVYEYTSSSPAFNYAFRREDDTIKLGLNFYFGAAPAAPPYPVQAPRLK
jgi:hypothetical protein